MSNKPDFGLHLLKEGWTPEEDYEFLNFRIYNISILGGYQYSTMVEFSLEGGELYALSVDFNQEQLEQILSKASSKITSMIRAELKHDSSTPRLIDLNGEISFGIRTRLDQLQHSQTQNESFVPLIIKEIF